MQSSEDRPSTETNTVIMYNFSGKNVKMQMKARKEWCEEKSSLSPPSSLPDEAASHMQTQGGSGKDFKTGIKNSPNIVLMASWVYTDVRNEQIVQFNVCSFFVCQLSCLKNIINSSIICYLPILIISRMMKVPVATN